LQSRIAQLSFGIDDLAGPAVERHAFAMESRIGGVTIESFVKSLQRALAQAQVRVCDTKVEISIGRRSFI